MRNIKSLYILVLVQIFLFYFNVISFSQTEINKTYQICLTNIPVQDFTFIYTHKINNKIHLEISNSIVIHKSKEFDNAAILFFGLKDPFRLYDMYRLRIGNRFFIDDESYICPMLIFNYGRYKNGLIKKYIDDYGSDAYDKDYILSRNRYDVGLILKSGCVTTIDNRFLYDIYFGLGCKVKIFDEDIIAIKHRSGVQYFNPPTHNVYAKIMPTVHFGLCIGYYK